MLMPKSRFTLSGTTSQITKMTIFMLDGSGRGHRKGTLYIPSFGIEQNVMGVVERRFNRVIGDWTDRRLNGEVLATVGSATRLESVSNSSIVYRSETYSNWPKGNFVSTMPSYDS